jgi:AcrR family transcriptional regulator
MEVLEKVSLRERKVARVRLALVRSLRERINLIPFQQIRVEDLCEEALISKVTFFKYFPEKEALLVFASACWMMEIQVEIRKNGLVGMQAIKRLFDLMSSVCTDSPNFMRAFHAMLSEKVKFPVGIELSNADKVEMFPDVEPREYETRSMGNFIQRHIRLALESGQIKTQLSEFEISCLVGTMFNGSGILGQRVYPDRPGDLFILNYQILCKCLNYN